LRFNRKKMKCHAQLNRRHDSKTKIKFFETLMVFFVGVIASFIYKQRKNVSSK
jgi:hypothetical protein